MTRIRGRLPHPTALNAPRRARELADVAGGAPIDILVVGGGITGAGIALDAAARGLRTVLVERGDLAQGTSGFSSKLVHGGLRYLASGRLGIAHESAVERHLLMTRIAPHLTRPLAQIVPLYGASTAEALGRGAYVGAGYALGDALRRGVGTPASLLPPPSRLSAAAARALAPAVAVADLRGGIRGWDGQLVDDARLVVAVARTAAGVGARILTRVEAVALRGDGADLRDLVTGEGFTVSARAVVNAAGVWAGTLTPSVALQPSRGTHLVVDTARLGGADVSLTAPVPGSRGRFVFTLPALHGRTYIGLTDVATDELSDAPRADESEIDFLLDSISVVLAEPLTRADVLGTFSGLRPLLRGPSADPAHAGQEQSADLSRRHAVIEADEGVLSVVGGKLTTYRRMAQDGVDVAVRRRGLPSARPSPTADLPLVGAWPRPRAAEIRAAARLVRRYGAESPFVAERGRDAPASPAAARGVTAAELEWGVRVEGALTIGDLLERRTRLSLVSVDAEASAPAAAAAFARAGVEPLGG